MRRIKTIKEFISIADETQKKCVSFDWGGTLFDGTRAIEGMTLLLKELKNNGFKTVIISNGPESYKGMWAKVRQYGFTRNLIDDVFTSGMLAADQIPNIYRVDEDKTPFYQIGVSNKNHILKNDSRYCEVDKIEDAIFAVAGELGVARNADSFIDEIMECVNNRLDFMCITPETHFYDAKEGLIIRAGSIADEFEKNDAVVYYFGKSKCDTDMFEFAYYDLGFEKEEIMHVGDITETDIVGAQTYGVDTVLVTGGLTAHLAGNNLEGYLKEIDIMPDYIF